MNFNNKEQLATLGGIAILLVFIGVVAVLVLRYNVGTKTPTMPTTPTTESSTQLAEKATKYLWQGNRQSQDEAVVILDRLIRDSSTIEESFQYKIQRAYAYFFRSGSEKDRRRGIEELKTFVKDENTPPSWKGFAIMALLEFYYSDAHISVAKMIFKGDFFEPFLEGEDFDSALKQLAEYSTNLYPSSLGYLFTSFWYTNQLLDARLSESTQDDFKEKILELTDIAQAAFDNESRGDELLLQQEGDSAQPLGIIVNSRAIKFYTYKAFALGAAATHDNALVPSFEKAAEMAIERFKSGENATLALPQNIIQFAYFYRAAFLNRIFGEIRQDNVESDLNSLLALVHGDIDPQINQFLIFVRSQRDLKPADRKHNYEFFVELAEVSPAFTSFLKKEGWFSS